MDNLTFAGGSATPTAYGHYTSAANIGVYLWAVVSARDLGIINEAQAKARVQATLTEVSHLQRYDGFLYQWYDTTNGDVLTNPGQGDCTETTPAFDNCFFVSNVDNGWYASGLIVVREALPELAHLADSLIAPMNFGLFYDARAETHCNVNPAITGSQPTGQMYGGYYAGLPHPNLGLSQCHGCATEDVVTPHASFLALDVAPQQAYANITALRADYPGLYGPVGFFDAVDPVTGAVGHRDLVLDQSMIMGALDNALNNRAIQRDFASDPVSWAAHTYLSMETMSL
jgi:hypothetical protein